MSCEGLGWCVRACGVRVVPGEVCKHQGKQDCRVLSASYTVNILENLIWAHHALGHNIWKMVPGERKTLVKQLCPDWSTLINICLNTHLIGCRSCEGGGGRSLTGEGNQWEARISPFAPSGLHVLEVFVQTRGDGEAARRRRRLRWR